MPSKTDGAVFRTVIRMWSSGDLEGVLRLLADDIVHTVHVGELDVPYMISATGKAEVRQRLQLIAATFVVDAFVIESLVETDGEIRAIVRGYHKHRKSAERLDVTLRFLARVEDNVITRLDEYVDAAYFDALSASCAISKKRPGMRRGAERENFGGLSDWPPRVEGEGGGRGLVADGVRGARNASLRRASAAVRSRFGIGTDILSHNAVDALNICRSNVVKSDPLG